MGKLNMNEINTMKEYITDHCNQSMNKAIDAERFPLWKRSCGECKTKVIMSLYIRRERHGQRGYTNESERGRSARYCAKGCKQTV